ALARVGIGVRRACRRRGLQAAVDAARERALRLVGDEVRVLVLVDRLVEQAVVVARDRILVDEGTLIRIRRRTRDALRRAIARLRVLQLCRAVVSILVLVLLHVGTVVPRGAAVLRRDHGLMDVLRLRSAGLRVLVG